MGNPKRYIFQKQFPVKVHHDYKEDGTGFKNDQIKLTVFEDDKFLNFYENAQIDFYSAPDVYFTYSNGNTGKDEWERYFRWEFKNLKLISKVQMHDELTATYSYEEFKDVVFKGDDPEMVTDIPMGKFAGMTYEQVQNYRRKNKFYFKGQYPTPSKEALDAAMAAQPTLEWPSGEEEVKEMLIAAYKVDF